MVVNRKASCLGIWKAQSVIYWNKGKENYLEKNIMSVVWAMLEVPEGCPVMCSTGG